jgi:hypothetical protein
LFLTCCGATIPAAMKPLAMASAIWPAPMKPILEASGSPDADAGLTLDDELLDASADIAKQRASKSKDSRSTKQYERQILFHKIT